MSDEETYQLPGLGLVEDEEGERPPVKLGIPEKQPRDLGIHKIVFDGRGQPPSNLIDQGVKNKEKLSESITIVQDDYCGRGKEEENNNRCVRRRLISASFICLIFIVMEFTGGYFSNSLVIAADAAQLLTVFSTMMVSLFALRLSGRKPHQSTPLAWYQAEAVIALASVLTTWVLTSIVVYLAYERIVSDNFTIDVDMMLATSAFAVVANLVMGMVLHNTCHVRICNSDSDPFTGPAVNVSVRAAFMHIVCDFLFSLAVFVTALFIDCCYLLSQPDWHIVDPISTIVFSVFVLCITLAVLKDVLNVLLKGMPKGIYFNDILKTFLSINGVQQVQNLRLWAHTLDKVALSAHLTIRPGVDHNEVLKMASRRIHSKYNFYEMTIHIEALQDSEEITATVHPQIEKSEKK